MSTICAPRGARASQLGRPEDEMLRTWLLIVVPLMALALVDLVERARLRAGESHKALALCQGISPAQWSRELRGIGHVALDRIVESCPTPFVAALLEEIAVLRGLSLERVFHLRAS